MRHLEDESQGFGFELESVPRVGEPGIRLLPSGE